MICSENINNKSSCSSRSPQVNLKEQGQLIRQDEFTVWSGRRKCQRHIFLFQELVLFSKLRKVEGGLDVFIYKQSYKVSCWLRAALRRRRVLTRRSAVRPQISV